MPQLSTHAPGLTIAAASMLVPSIAMAVDPSTIPALGGPDSPVWLGPLVMALGFLAREGIAFLKDWVAADRKKLQAENSELKEENADLKEKLSSAQARELADAKRIVILEGEAEVTESRHASGSERPRPTDGVSPSPETTPQPAPEPSRGASA